MDADSQGIPEFGEMRTKDPDAAIEAIFGPAMAATPVLTEPQFRGAFQSLRNSWGPLPLVEGSADEVREILLHNARAVAAQTGFREFQVSLIAGPDYAGEEAVQVYAWFPSEGRIVRVWKSEQAFHAYGTPSFLAKTTPPGLIELPNQLGIGDGTPLLLEEEPDVERILADPNPQPPQRITDRNRGYWEEFTPEQIRTSLVSAYLAHPRAAVRIDTLRLAGNLANGAQLADMLVDRSAPVRTAAAEAIWDRSPGGPPISTTLAFVIRVLHDEVKRTGLISHMSAAQALEALKLLKETRPERADDFNKWLIDAWVREEEPLTEQGFRLVDLHALGNTFVGPAQAEAREIGAEIDRAGGLQAMEAIREAIGLGLGDQAEEELTTAWQGVGPWPVAEAREERVEEEPPPLAGVPVPTLTPVVEGPERIPEEPAPVRAPAPAAPQFRAPVAAPTPVRAGASNGLAIASLVLGIVSLPASCCYGFGALPGIGALVMGFIARRQIRESSGAQEGDGLAIAGIVTGGIAVAAGVMVVVLLAIGLLGQMLGRQ